MIKVVKENPCAECGIKGLYENCNDECVQYRKWYQYQQGRADAIDEFAELLLKHKSKDDYPVMCFDEWTIKKIVEQLKERK